MPGVVSVFIVAERPQHLTVFTQVCHCALQGAETVRRLMPGVFSVFIVAERLRA
jgi:hypothetical protein